MNTLVYKLVFNTYLLMLGAKVILGSNDVTTNYHILILIHISMQ
jgi:hypothetical protein